MLGDEAQALLVSPSLSDVLVRAYPATIRNAHSYNADRFAVMEIASSRNGLQPLKGGRTYEEVSHSSRSACHHVLSDKLGLHVLVLKVFRYRVHLDKSRVHHDQPVIGTKHTKALSHVVERNPEAGVLQTQVALTAGMLLSGCSIYLNHCQAPLAAGLPQKHEYQTGKAE